MQHHAESIEAVEADVSQFVAPRPPSAGSPTPEAMARLQAAIDKTPTAETAAPSQPQPKPAAEKPRFGINSLINRMTGHGEEDTAPKAQTHREQPPVQSPEAGAEMDPEQERIEIPAFLRRQAN